jgi:23S rRNA (pseudouridine1915-N3)-methyltransferase
MRLTIIAVGRLSTGAERALYDDYAKRMKGGLALVEVEERRKLPPAELVRREGALIRAAIPKGAAIVALDRRGTALSSEELAARLTRWANVGRNVAFLVGGADGLEASLREDADLVLSFGAATWPHALVRVMLAEQLYRAQAILSGHPYHRAG